MSDRIRIGFVGLGGIARSRHVPGLKAISGVELVAVANRSRESSEKAAQEFNIPVVCDTWQDVVTHPDVDAVVIGTWPYLHCPVSVAALEAGKHVFCQARMAMNYDEARRMHAAATQSGKVAALCPVPIGLSVDKTIARLLAEDYLGAIRLVRVQSLGSAFASAEKPMSWRKDERLSGLNMHTLGMFVEVIHRWFGWTHSVAGDTQIFVPERTTPEGERRPVTIPDQILFNAVMRAGFPAQYVISAAVHHGTDRIEVYGEKGTLVYDVSEDILYAAGRDEALTPIPQRDDEWYDVQQWRVEQDFIDAIREGKPYHPDFEDGLRYMQVVEGVYTAAAKQQTVVLEG